MKTLTILLFTSAAALTFNIFLVHSGINNELIENIIQLYNAPCEGYLIIAQKENSRDTRNNQDSRTTSNAAQSGSKKNSKQQKQPSGKSLKKFVPSEKIDVDTVVDFPIDI